MQNHLAGGHQEAIRNLIATYNICGDSDDLEGLARTFAPDGALALSSGQVLLGRTEIIEFLKARRAARAASAGAERRRGHHHLSTCRIDLINGTTAQAQSYFLVITAVGPDHAGTYRDNFILRDDGWLIARRQVTIDWVSEHSHWFAGEPKSQP